MPVERGGAADVVYVLCLMQAAFLLLGGLGEVVLMGGNPAYLILPMAKMVLLFVFAAKVVSGRRWALVALIVVQGITLVGFWLQFGAGFLPWVDFTVNLVGLITNVAMPASVVYLCATVLVSQPSAEAQILYGLPVPQDPYAPAPLVTTATAPQLAVPYVVASSTGTREAAQ